jgi:hypothetical protein
MAPTETALWDMGLPRIGVRMVSLEHPQYVLCCQPALRSADTDRGPAWCDHAVA